MVGPDFDCLTSVPLVQQKEILTYYVVDCTRVQAFFLTTFAKTQGEKNSTNLKTQGLFGPEPKCA